jgi:hypothetical protein
VSDFRMVPAVAPQQLEEQRRTNQLLGGMAQTLNTINENLVSMGRMQADLVELVQALAAKQQGAS